MSEYASAAYWNERYSREVDVFEWYQEFSGIKHILTPYLNKYSNVLVIGCGNSALSENILSSCEVSSVVSIDISSVVIDNLKRKYINTPNMTFSTMDIRKLEFPAEKFDVIVDKGCFDSMLCGDDSDKFAEQAIAECCRVLVPGGTMILISHATPENREPMFKSVGDTAWSAVKCSTIGKPKLDDIDIGGSSNSGDDVHYVYTAQKLKKR